MNASTEQAGHVPVLLEAVLALLEPRPGAIALDCTLGRGGHAAAILPRLSPGGRYIGLDVDAGNLEFARQRLEPTAREVGVELILRHANFQEAPAILETLSIAGADLLLADLGFASNQMADPSRGFSFNEDGPLDMRLDPSQGPTAGELVNTLPERDLADMIYQYGEERLSRKIARKIVELRRTSPIQTTRQLADLVRQAYGPRAYQGGRMRIHPATRTFMALRIAVNGELDALDRLLETLPGLLTPGGRAAIISFHSLEDRRVKHALADLERRELGKRLTRKPITADESERDHNPRGRSAKLRGFEREA